MTCTTCWSTSRDGERILHDGAWSKGVIHVANAEIKKAKNKKMAILGIVLVIAGAVVVITGWINDIIAYNSYQACWPCPSGLAIARLARNLEYACLIFGATSVVLGIVVWVRAAKAQSTR
jgi:hypothetical protein